MIVINGLWFCNIEILWKLFSYYKRFFHLHSSSRGSVIIFLTFYFYIIKLPYYLIINSYLTLAHLFLCLGKCQEHYLHLHLNYIKWLLRQSCHSYLIELISLLLFIIYIFFILFLNLI